jgi:hypothetical protein
MWQDPIVTEVRKIREALAARFDYDVRALCQALQEQEQQSERPKVSFPPKRVKNRSGKSTAEARNTPKALESQLCGPCDSVVKDFSDKL